MRWNWFRGHPVLLGSLIVAILAPGLGLGYLVAAVAFGLLFYISLSFAREGWTRVSYYSDVLMTEGLTSESLGNLVYGAFQILMISFSIAITWVVGWSLVVRWGPWLGLLVSRLHSWR